MNAKILAISCSLNPVSRSKILYRRACGYLESQGIRVQTIDLAQMSVPLCDADSCYEDPAVQDLTSKIAAADGIFLAVPIYNYGVNAAAKNLVELTGNGWEGKVVGFLCAGGGRSSYMAVMSIANSLMLDFCCIILPRFVYATKDSFTDGTISDEGLDRRTCQFADTFVDLTQRIKG